MKEIINNKKDEYTTGDPLNKERDIFKSALSEALDNKFDEIDKVTAEMKNSSPSRRHKIKMNRLFREQVGGAFLPFPEADNFYERIRSKLITKFKTSKLLTRHKKRNKTKRK